MGVGNMQNPMNTFSEIRYNLHIKIMAILDHKGGFLANAMHNHRETI